MLVSTSDKVVLIRGDSNHGGWLEGGVSLSPSGEGEGATDGFSDGEVDGLGGNRAVGMMGELSFLCCTLVHPAAAGA